MPKKKSLNIFLLIFSLFVTQFAGLVGTLFITPSIPVWYASLNKPFFNPPNWVFAPVWTILYLTMGVALYLVWQQGWQKSAVKKALKFFFTQLILNTLWTFIFFGLRMPELAFLEIIVLWILIFLNVDQFFKLNKLAGRLLIPYLAWVGFACVLNLAIVVLN